MCIVQSEIVCYQIIMMQAHLSLQQHCGHPCPLPVKPEARTDARGIGPGVRNKRTHSPGSDGLGLRRLLVSDPTVLETIKSNRTNFGLKQGFAFLRISTAATYNTMQTACVGSAHIATQTVCLFICRDSHVWLG